MDLFFQAASLDIQIVIKIKMLVQCTNYNSFDTRIFLQLVIEPEFPTERIFQDLSPAIIHKWRNRECMSKNWRKITPAKEAGPREVEGKQQSKR